MGSRACRRQPRTADQDWLCAGQGSGWGLQTWLELLEPVLCLRLAGIGSVSCVIYGRCLGDLHFPSCSRASWTRNLVICPTSANGSGFSNGNWIEPLAVVNPRSSLTKAFTAG